MTGQRAESLVAGIRVRQVGAEFRYYILCIFWLDTQVARSYTRPTDRFHPDLTMPKILPFTEANEKKHQKACHSR